MIKKSNRNFIGVFCMLLVMLTACTNSANKSDEALVDPIAEEALVEHDHPFPIVLPSPLQIASILKRSGLKFMDGVTNPAHNLEKYESSFDKAVNFGVYGADFSYCVINGQSQRGMEYLGVLKTLGDDLGLSNVFDSEDMFKNFEKNMTNEDSVIALIAQIQENMDEHLEGEETEYMAGVFFAGGWIEGMYLGAKQLEKGKNDKLLNHLGEQIGMLELTIKALNYNPNKTEDLVHLVSSLNNLKEIFSGIEAIHNYHDMEHLPTEKIELTPQEMETIIKAIKDLRNSVIKA